MTAAQDTRVRAEGSGDKIRPEISATEADWSREEIRSWKDSGRRLLRSIRRYQYWQQRKGVLAHFICKTYVFRHFFWSAVTGADIPLNSKIGGGLLIPHPNGIVIYPSAEIGPNCLIFQQVTIGTSSDGGVPKIGGHVDIGAGAKILGPVKIGDHARIGANAVVLHDVPPYATAIGVPAKVV